MQISWLVGIFLLGYLPVAWSQVVPTALLVDKSKNLLHVCESRPDGYHILKTYSTTLGKVKGDKQTEDDLKTPEGIYTFNGFSKPPVLPKKFGVMAFFMNFPNAFDRMAGVTGSGIMLHGTDNPDRTEKKFDSEGCVVLQNEEMREIQSYIRLGLTPILIFSTLTDEYLHAVNHSKMDIFFNNWIKNWKTKSLQAYMDAYHSDFMDQGKDKNAWRKYKFRLNEKYARIQIEPKNIFFYLHPKYTVVSFRQNYVSYWSSGKKAYSSYGTKMIYIAEEDDAPKIIAEHFLDSVW
jgi:murein L,D-transpeptidase YafK